ncbi:MAG TPA: HlyD family efflux transporter periplasmic adaptor subunit [Solirubrobacteraceae bacterium]|jgi:HlyD family secretion protein/macrolide-specific efflux system membrane fusion protein|nr:HlyD family efflux transporter periplasmic adaptor subunit [Solirubrobacteraceae bacterium]
MNEHSGRPWPIYLLGLAAIGAIVTAYLVVGPPSQSTASATRIVTAQSGVVTSTVSGSGNVEAAKQLDLGFKTGGVVSHIYVSQGQHVVEGQLLAELDPESAEVTLEQARATLKTAEANLAQEEETDGEGSSSSGAAGTRATTASIAYTTRSLSTSTTEAMPQSTSGTSIEGKTGQEGTGHSKQQNEDTGTSKANKPASGGDQEHKDAGGKGASPPSSSSSSTSSSGKSSASTLSSAARAANIASASAAVKSDKLAVQSDEEALANTKLYAPQTGTLVSLSGEVGETVSGTGTTKASSGSSSSEGSDAAASSSALGRSTAAASRESTDDSSSTGSSFAVLSDLSSMQLVVPMSESEIGQVKDGQPATVTIEALEGSKLAAEVTAISMLPTSNSGVVSYDVTFTLDQRIEGLRPGMSATAEVVVKQAEGVNVPSSAITGGTVTVLHEGKQVRRSVLTGLAGSTSTIVVSGLSAGEQVVLPAARSTSSTSSLLSRLGSRLGGSGLGGGAFRGGGFAAGAPGG